MKRHKILVKYIVSMMFFITIALINNKANAAGLSIRASKSTVNEGDSVTITVSSEYTGRVDITTSGGSLSNSKVWIENNEQSVTLKADAKDKITVTATPSGKMSDSNGGKVDAQSTSTTITIKSNSSGNNTQSGNSNENKPVENKPKEPSFKSVEEKVYATGNANIRKSYSADSEIIDGVQKNESLTRVGIGDNGWSKVTYNGETGYVKSSLLTTEKPKKSEDKTLKTLSIEGFEMNPAFDSEITEYSVSVGEDVEKLNITVVPNDEKSKFEIVGNETLQAGDNIVKITVTAEDLTTRLYTINVTKQTKEVLSLSSIKIEGFALNPKFSPDVLEYKLTIQDPDVNKVDVVALASVENAKVEVVGNTDLKQGENVIQINVTSEDGQETITYKIIVNKTNSASMAGTNQSNWMLYVGITVIVLLVIIIIVVVIRAKKKSKLGNNKNLDNQDYSDLYGFSSRNNQSFNDSQVDDYIGNAGGKRHLEDELFGKLTEVDIDDDFQNINGKYENGFNYNPYNTSNINEDNYKTYATVNTENNDIFSGDDSIQDSGDWDDDENDYRSKKARGKHSK